MIKNLAKWTIKKFIPEKEYNFFIRDFINGRNLLAKPFYLTYYVYFYLISLYNPIKLKYYYKENSIFDPKIPLYKKPSIRACLKNIERVYGNDVKVLEELEKNTFKGDIALYWSESKDEQENYIKTEFVKLLVNKIKSLNDKISVMDFGCGTGKTVGVLDKLCKDKIKENYGVDISKEAIDLCYKKFKSKKYKFYANDLLDFVNLHNKRYDIIYSHWTLQLINPIKLKEIFKKMFNKKLCKYVIIADTYFGNNDLDKDKESVYHPINNTFIRYNHNYPFLLKEAGFKIEKFIDNRKVKGQPNELIVIAKNPKIK